MEKEKSKSIIGIILIVLVLVVCGLTYAYTATDIFKSPEKLFKKYLSNNIESLKKVNVKPLDELLKRSSKEASEFNLEFGMESNGKEMKATVEGKTDIKNKKEYASLKVTDSENEYFNMEFLMGNETLGIQIDELHEKYLALENRDLKKLAKTFGLDEEDIEQIPDKLEFLESSYSEEDMKKAENLKEKYLKKIDEQIDKSKYKMEKNVKTDVNGEEVTANKYTLTLTTKEIAQIERNITTELFDDPEFIELYEKSSSKETLEELKEDVIITELDIENMEEKNVDISVYEKESKTIKTDIVSDENKIDFIVDNSKPDESTILLSMYTAKSEDKEVGQTVNIKFNNKYENKIGTTTLEIANIYDKADIEETYSPEDYEDEDYKIVLKTEKKDENNIVMNIMLDDVEKLMEDEDIKISKCELAYNFNNNVEIENLSEENALILNDYTEAQFGELFQELLKNAYESSQNNPNSLIGMLAQYAMFLSGLSSVTPNGTR